MATIKSFTSLEQSQRLAEILPLDSADMYYAGNQSIINPKEWEYRDTPEIRGKYTSFDDKRIFYPCWSLAALFGALPDRICLDNEKYYLNYKKDKVEYLGPLTWDGQKCITSKANTLVDVCYEMILKLHELKML